MPQLAYPVGSDVQALLTSHGFTVSTALAAQLNQAAASAQTSLERRTRRVFLPVTAARAFDPPTNPQGELDLKADLASVTTVVYAGTALVSGAAGGYVAESHTNLPPYTRLRFLRRWYAPLTHADRQQLVVTGTWGYAAEGIPDDVWEAMRQQAALTVFPQLVFANTGGLTGYTRAGVTENFGANPLGALQTGWKAIVEQVITDYTRVI